MPGKLCVAASQSLNSSLAMSVVPIRHLITVRVSTALCVSEAGLLMTHLNGGHQKPPVDVSQNNLAVGNMTGETSVRDLTMVCAVISAKTVISHGPKTMRGNGTLLKPCAGANQLGYSETKIS